MDEHQLARITVPGTEVKQCSIVVPTREAPYFARQHFTFPAAPLSDVAPAASQVSSSTLGTGLYGVVRPHTTVGHPVLLILPDVTVALCGIASLR